MFRSRLPATRRGWLVAGYMAAALVLGGGGSPSAAAEVLVQLAFVAALAGWVWWARAPLAAGPGALALVAALPLALAAAQLVPLPPTLWHALPGRALALRSLALVGAGERWMPVSLAPAQTLAALLAMIPPIGAMLATARLGHRDRQALLLLVALVGLAAALLGAAQLGARGDELRLYEQAHRPWVTGFFANRNSAADGFLIAALALCAWSATATTPGAGAGAGRGAPRIARAAALAVLGIALVLTGSRAGIALAVPAALVMMAMGTGGNAAAPALSARRAAAVLAGGGALAAAAILALPRVAGVAERFAVTSDFRLLLWRDAWAAAARTFPVGSGLGTFAAAYLPVESLELVDATYPSRAHNEALELLIEAGALAPLVVLAILVALARLWRRAAAAPAIPRAHRLFAGGALLVMGLHSLVDYPLRSMALASLAGMAVGLLVPREEEGRVMFKPEPAR